ncbi:MAG: glycosyltransferase family 39 protein [Bacteroidales bacterium]|nr:glycosyltransferase family 39 protein [Bacteroidales bacterium]
MEQKKIKWFDRINTGPGDWPLILFFAATGLAVHFITYDNFELHRDAYLYYAQSEHLAWGFFSVPPFTALVTKFATLIFGNTVFGMRFFPAIIGSVNVILLGLAVKELGGKKIAMVLAMLAYLTSPAYLHVNFLLQPTCFNQFFWLLSGYLILVMIKRNKSSMWLWIALVFGLGFLNKYSIVFFYAAFGIALLISPYRSFLKSRYFFLALAIGFVVILPNLIWQYIFQWPVISHMEELRETQLVHVRISDFLLEQFMMNAQAMFLWFGALLVVLFKKEEKQYRLFGFIFIIVIFLLMFGSGKSYYTLGVYPMMFVFGAYFTEKYLKKSLLYFSGFLVLWMFTGLYISFFFDGVPFITFERAMRKDAFRWEDGTYHDLPQDVADMTGWKEIGEKVSDIFLDLGTENINNCDIFCYHYGQAGAVMFYGKKSNIPQPISFNGSFLYWSPDSLTKDYMIWVHSDLYNDFQPDSILPLRFEKVTLLETINNPNFREDGTRIYLCEKPNDYYKNYYKELVDELKSRYR